jgi:hypothetical protein
MFSNSPPQPKPAWYKIKGMLSAPSHKWPRSQNWALPIRQYDTRLRAANRPAKTIKPVPMIP